MAWGFIDPVEEPTIIILLNGHAVKLSFTYFRTINQTALNHCREASSVLGSR